MKYLIASLLIAVACLADSVNVTKMGASGTNFTISGSTEILTYHAWATFSEDITKLDAHDNLTWESRDKTLAMHRREELVTNWVTAETIDLGATPYVGIDLGVSGPARLNRLIQVGKIVTNEVIRIEFQQHTNTVTYEIGESGYTAQRWITNKAFLSSSITFTAH